jgi:hypothetical protein
MRPFWLRLLAVVAALALALPAFAWSSGRFLCQMTGRVGAACCCAKAHAKSAEHVVPAVQQKSCCERVDVAAPVLAPALHEAQTDGWVSLPAEVMALVVIELPRIAPVEQPRLARAPPQDLALFLQNCALLI